GGSRPDRQRRNATPRISPMQPLHSPVPPSLLGAKEAPITARPFYDRRTVQYTSGMKAVSSFAAEHTVATVCPLDCPDSCSLDVTIQDGRIAAIDGSDLNPITAGYICAKVRRFPERIYGPDRLIYPALRKGPKGFGGFE